MAGLVPIRVSRICRGADIEYFTEDVQRSNYQARQREHRLRQDGLSAVCPSPRSPPPIPALRHNELSADDVHLSKSRT